MGIYIKGMEMPTSCLECVFYRRTDPIYDYCCISSAIPKEYVPNDCPLIPVPLHGNLIDQDYVKEHLYACETNGRPLHKLELYELLDVINDIPTIIPASENEK